MAPPNTEAQLPTPQTPTDPTATATPIPTPTQTPTPTPTAAPVPTPTPMPTATPTPAPSPTTPPTLVPAPTPVPAPTAIAGAWHGLIIADESRCSPYDSDLYRYSPSVELNIVDQLGAIYGPCTGTYFESIRETDIEHIVARSEAHDSGLCAADPAIRRQFANDLLNLTLASPSVNRHQKVDKDVAEWLPALNQCWYVDRVVQVRVAYGLTIDRKEAAAIDRVLAGCQSTDMIRSNEGITVMATATPRSTATAEPSGGVDALALYDDNGNGRITCAEARAHGIAPVRRGHPAYQYMRDADGDGIVCE